jgi:hypothetical protein
MLIFFEKKGVKVFQNFFFIVDFFNSKLLPLICTFLFSPFSASSF